MTSFPIVPDVGRVEDLAEEPGFDETVALARSDMPMDPELFKRQEQALLRFINHQLEEAEYREERWGTKIVRTNDYYVVPGSKQKALTRKGAENLAKFFRLKVARSDTKIVSLEADFVAVKAKVAVHRSNVIHAEREAACTTAEKAFQSARARKKYGAIYKKQNDKDVETKPPDYRAALNDVEARAQKRAYVNAIIVALAATDILHVADELEEDDIAAPADGAPGKPTPPTAADGGATTAQLKTLERLAVHAAFTDEQRRKLSAWLNDPKATRDRVDDQIVLMEDAIREHEAKRGKVGSVPDDGYDA